MQDIRPDNDHDIAESNHDERSSFLPNLETQTRTPAPKQPPHKRQPSITYPGTPRTPRTPNRVRFDLDVIQSIPNGHAGTGAAGSPDDEEEDYFSRGRRSSTGQRAPLLTNIEAPTVTTALDLNVEDLLENARPKSGISSAFMNMANSIIGAGIIGQPYAFRQAGMLTGILLLVSLTVVVDWTIRLIVINSKLSGSSSFQGSVQHCFGKPGLIAISTAQWSFAFGGMLAFCIIIGDTIPKVIAAVFPSLPHKPFLWLLCDRRAIIILCVLSFSYPLSLYRDIAKVKHLSIFESLRLMAT